MAVDFKTYLATEVISEQRTVSYRTLSRALKVHVNVAKCMLYEFHEHENKKKAGSVYATYLFSGIKIPTQQSDMTNGATNGHDGVDDQIPPSSPPPLPSSMADPSEEKDGKGFQVPVTTITLVREEMLENMRAQYEKITSIHLYSLSPHRIQDLVALTDIGRSIFANTFVNEDPLIHNKTYGVIQNPEVRRRKGNKPIIEAAPPRFKAVKEESKSAPADVAGSSAQETGAAKSALKRENSASDNISKSLAKSSNAKKGKSDLFRSFAKTGSKPRLKPEDTGTSASGTDDAKMTDADDEGDSEDEALFLDTNTKKPATSKKRGSDAKKEREDKAAKLRKMMEDDDDVPAVPNVEDASGVKPGTPILKDSDDEQMADGEDDVVWSASDTEQQRRKPLGKNSSAKQEEENVITEPKRRRGKRKVMKKKTMKDEDGYLVTKEEAIWESFSEDEPEPKKPKPSFPTSSAKASSQTKSTAGKSSAKLAGSEKTGGIMSFFGKK